MIYSVNSLALFNNSSTKINHIPFGIASAADHQTLSQQLMDISHSQKGDISKAQDLASLIRKNGMQVLIELFGYKKNYPGIINLFLNVTDIRFWVKAGVSEAARFEALDIQNPLQRSLKRTLAANEVSNIGKIQLRPGYLTGAQYDTVAHMHQVIKECDAVEAEQRQHNKNPGAEIFKLIEQNDYLLADSIKRGAAESLCTTACFLVNNELKDQLVQLGISDMSLCTAKLIGQQRNAGHTYIAATMNGKKVIIDPTIGQFLKGYNKVFVGTREELRTLFEQYRGKIQHISTPDPDIAFQRIIGRSSQPYGRGRM